MADMNDKIEVLNRFMGWEPISDSCGIDMCLFNPYADTPEAREWTRRLKDEFVRRTGHTVHVTTGLHRNAMSFYVELTCDREPSTLSPIEHYAILDAIYEAIKHNDAEHGNEAMS